MSQKSWATTHYGAPVNSEELRQKRLLVIDDDPLMLDLLRAALKSTLQVHVALGGEEGLEQARTEPQPDLILLDVSMPGMTGHEVCEALKADPATRDIPVIFSTAADHEEDETVGFALGAVDYITKPYRLPVVKARVRAHLETRHLYHQIRLHNLMLDAKVRERTRALEAEVRSRRQAEDRFTHQLYHHPLTGLPNRLLLQEEIRRLAAGAAQQPFALVLLSLAGFHEINNTLGYETGSQLLRQVAQRFNRCATELSGSLPIESGAEPHMVAVVAGVNFGLLLDARCAPEVLAATVQTLLDVLEQPFEFEGMSLSVGACAGIAVSPEHGTEPDTLLRHTHIAVEEASASDKHIVIYSDSINRYSARRLSLMGELRTAIQQDALQLAFQPQLDLGARRVVSVEALLRWQHPKLGFVRPDEFIPMAEQGGVIKPLTAWVLRAAVRQCRVFIDEGLDIGVSVNLSARNLREADLVEQVLELLREYEVPPARLMLEVTETAVMKSPDAALKILGQLQAAGVRSSIDDFGTGYSSLGYLKNLPVSEVKIDRSFVMEMMTDKDDQVIVQTIVSMGKNLGLHVVAEGVEDAASLEALRDMGCELAQGYHICKPQFPEQLIEWLRNSDYAPVSMALP